MATFITIVHADPDGGFTASFPDFPGCTASSQAIGEVIGRAREALLKHVEELLLAGQTVRTPTAIEAIQRSDELLFAAIEIPENHQVQVEIAVPALSLARMESFADRYGLSLGALFVKAVDRWAGQEAPPRERASAIPDGPTLFDFSSPAELRVEAAAREFAPAQQRRASDNEKDFDAGGAAEGIAAELARLLDARPANPDVAADRSIAMARPVGRADGS